MPDQSNTISIEDDSDELPIETICQSNVINGDNSKIQKSKICESSSDSETDETESGSFSVYSVEDCNESSYDSEELFELLKKK